MPEPTDFEELYRGDADPFGVATRWYERRKQRVLLASLTREHYALAWDAACGTGHLTRALAVRCRKVLATDSSPRAVELTGDLVSDHRNVHQRISALPAQPGMAGDADLTVLAEVLYYLDDDARAQTLEMAAAQSGEVVTVHWRHHPEDAYLSGEATTEELGSALESAGWDHVARHDDQDFVLGVWTRGADR